MRDGLDFLGQRMTAKVRLLRKANVRRFWRRTRIRVRDYFDGTLLPTKLEAQLNAWLGHLRQADAKGLERKAFSKLVERGVWLCRAPGGAWRVF